MTHSTTTSKIYCLVSLFHVHFLSSPYFMKPLKTIIPIQTINFCSFLLFPSLYLMEVSDRLFLVFYAGCFIPSVFHVKKQFPL